MPTPRRCRPAGAPGCATTATSLPSEETYKAHAWEKPFLPNLTGTTQAYRPQGSVLASGQRPSATGDYVPWTPGE